MVTLETPRLQLRPWRADDLDHYLQIFSKAPAMAFQMNRGLTREEAHGFLQFHIDTWEGHPFGHWAVLTKAHGRPIGWVGLESTSSFTGAPDGLQIGWRLDPDHWGHGYATESALAVLRYAFEELGLTKVYVLFHPDNHRSARVAAKLAALPLPPLRAPDQSEVRRVHVVDRETFANRG
jgi:RimJ/RimL family protein N-acetyltransferase